MIMNLFRFEKSVFNSDKLFQSTHLKSNLYKERTKTLESTLGQFCRIKIFSTENKLRLQPNAIIKRKTFNPGRLVGDRLSTNTGNSIL